MGDITRFGGGGGVLMDGKGSGVEEITTAFVTTRKYREPDLGV